MLLFLDQRGGQPQLKVTHISCPETQVELTSEHARGSEPREDTHRRLQIMALCKSAEWGSPALAPAPGSIHPAVTVGDNLRSPAASPAAREARRHTLHLPLQALARLSNPSAIPTCFDTETPEVYDLRRSVTTYQAPARSRPGTELPTPPDPATANQYFARGERCLAVSILFEAGLVVRKASARMRSGTCSRYCDAWRLVIRLCSHSA